MRLTRVRELRAGPDRLVDAEILYGEPVDCTGSPNGRICFFPPNELVAYLIRVRSRSQLVLFRTLAAPEPLASFVPGVASEVRVLLVVSTLRGIGRVRGLLHVLAQLGHNLRDLSDSLYLRAGAVLGRQRSVRDVARALLLHESDR
jgi:hypothetical protein